MQLTRIANVLFSTFANECWRSLVLVKNVLQGWTELDQDQERERQKGAKYVIWREIIALRDNSGTFAQQLPSH